MFISNKSCHFTKRNRFDMQQSSQIKCMQVLVLLTAMNKQLWSFRSEITLKQVLSDTVQKVSLHTLGNWGIIKHIDF